MGFLDRLVEINRKKQRSRFRRSRKAVPRKSGGKQKIC